MSSGGVFFVLLGVVFGFVVKRRKYPHSENPDDLMPIEFKKKQWELKKEKWENFWEYVLIIGLGLELAVLPHSINGYEELRKSNLELQDKLHDRTITTTQITNFIYLMEKVPKIPISICSEDRHGEAYSYAYQIRQLLKQAGYTTPTNCTATFGIDVNENVVNVRQPGWFIDWPFVQLISFSTNGIYAAWKPVYEKAPNGYSRPIVNNNDPIVIYGAIQFVFNQLGITTGNYGSANIVNPGEYKFFVLPKNFTVPPRKLQ
jgi:hypothetical protein